LRSPPLEDVLLERDEQANLVWLIEKVVLGAAGRPVPVEPGRPPLPEAAANAEDELPPDFLYQLATWVPQGWIPFLPVHEAPVEGSGRFLERALLLDTAEESLRDARGRIGQQLERLREEEVGREGVRVELLDQLARWTDGTSHLWRGRQRRAGKGESRAGLLFDAALPPRAGGGPYNS
jgi:hypothetical protein